MTNEEIAAFALAVKVREELLQSLDRLDLTPGDHFPVDQWAEAYAEAVKQAKRFEPHHPGPEIRVHKILPYLPPVDPIGPSK